METAPLKSFATWARRELITQVSARLTAVLAPASPERVESQRAVAVLERDIAAAGGGSTGREAIVDRVAYTWFNRIIAFRFMDANGYTGTGVVSPAHGQQTGQPEILADAKRGNIDPAVVGNRRTLDTIIGLLDGTRPSTDAQGEAYTLLLAEYCRYWNRSMPFMFEREGDYTELLIPSNLLAADSILTRAATALTEEVCRDVEVIGWLYQFYISERKDEVFAGFKKGKKAGAAEIPAATQLFTPHWIVRYLVENSVGRLWMLNHPESHLIEQMDYYIEPVDEQTDFLKISTPEELTVIDPACGSGHMLAYAFDLLYAIYEEEGYTPSEIPKLILTHNLYGTEIDPRAGALAAFALTIKARARQRAYFSDSIEPSIRILSPISFAPDEVEALLTASGDREAEAAFWNQFRHGDVLGSLVRPEPTLTAMLKQHVAQLDDEGDVLLAELLARAEQVVLQAELLLPRYSVAVANPPYMGTGNMDSHLSEFVKKHYREGKADLFACFILRSLELCKSAGRVAMITMHSWMFLPSYVKLRRILSSRHDLESMAHLGTGAFDSISGEVVSTTAFIFAPDTSRVEATGSYIRLVEGVSEVQKSGLLRAVASGNTRNRYNILNSEMADLPGGVIAYWLSSALLHAMTSSRLLGEVSESRCGMNTGENTQFVRNWWEVDRGRSRYDETSTQAAHATGCKWFPYNKGGTYRKWYGNQQFVVAFDPINYDILSKQGNHLPSRQFYFRPSVSWSKIAGSSPSFRYFPPGFVFDGAGMSLFTDSSQQRLAVLGLLNSTVSMVILGAIAPTLNFQSGDIARLPFPENLDLDAVTEIVARLVEVSKQDWDAQETSWNFIEDDLTSVAIDGECRLDHLVTMILSRQDQLVQEQCRNEEENNAIFLNAFGVFDELNATVDTRDVTLLANPAYAYGESRSRDVGIRRTDVVAAMISYAVGCMFGRYSLDTPGLLLADQGATVQDYLAKIPSPTFTPDEDNVLPIVGGDWFENDIVTRFRQFLRVAFGEENFEENLRFVEESLGVKSLREYFITRSGRSKFYDDHVKRYKKRPIYWLFSSSKGSFNALIYMHRYTSSTVSTVLNEYLREYITKLEASFQHQERLAAGEGTPRQKAAASKETERLRKILLELREYEHDVLYPLASKQVAIDLDDGVKANYPKFYPALRKIKGLEAADD